VSSLTRNSSLLAQIRARLKEPAAVSIRLVHNDFSAYESAHAGLEELCHVVEIYDFPPCFKTEDLVDAFTDYRWDLLKTSEGGLWASFPQSS